MFLMLLVQLLNVFTGGLLLGYGVFPGRVDSLPYIFTAPFIHGSWAHLLNNLVGFAVFSALSLGRGVQFYVRSSLIIVVLTGLLVWLFARHANHIGASGWIFGLWSLAIAMAWFQRRFWNIVIAIAVAFFYGGMIVGVMPRDPLVSFESHLFGAISGVAAAYLMTRPRRRKH